MKVALCLSGQIRSFDKTKNNIKENIIDVYNCDVFCHFWHRYDNSKYVNFYNPNCVVSYGGYDTNLVKEVIDFYNPVSITYEYPFIMQNTKSMFYSIHKSNNLRVEYEKRMNFTYDLVIRSRYDICLKSRMQVSEVNENTIYLSSRDNKNPNDWFAYGNSKSMNSYSDLFREYEDTERIKEICPEELLNQYLTINNVAIARPSFTYSIIREDGTEVF